MASSSSSNGCSKRGSLLLESSRNFAKSDSFSAETQSGVLALQREMGVLSVSERLVRSIAEKFRKNKKTRNANEDGEVYVGKERTNSRLSSKCLNLGGGCNRVGSCEDIDVYERRRLSFTDDCLWLKGVEKTGVECFSKKNLRKTKVTTQSADLCSLPDDVLELILIRLPLNSLVAARHVCKRWSCLIMTPQFTQLRIRGAHQSPWLFLFSVTRMDGFHAGEVHVLDVTSDRWHRISIENLIGRFSFSAAGIGTDVYILGGCATSAERHISKSLKDVFVFSPLTGSCREVSSMNVGRSGPALGVFRASSTCCIFHTKRKQCHSRFKSRIGGVSDVYEDPHRFSLRRQFKEASSNFPEPTKFAGQRRSDQSKLGLILIVVGGRGARDKPLDSAEVYDPTTDIWIEIARLPRDFGAVGSGAVCQGKFYVFSEADKLAFYDLDRGFWITIQTLQLPPRIREFCPMLVSCRSRLFMCCVSWAERDALANSRESAVRKFCELDIDTLSWGEVSRHPDAPMDSKAAFVAGEDRIYGVEMFTIFGQVLDFLTVCLVSDTGMKWGRISRKHGGHEAEASSCGMKSMVVLHV